MEEYLNYVIKQTKLGHLYVEHNTLPFSHVTNPDGIFIGTWYKRLDITRILDQLFECTNIKNKRFQLHTALDYYDSYLKNPSINKING
jgi:hypothetical protein